MLVAALRACAVCRVRVVSEREYCAADAQLGYGCLSFYTALRHDGLHTLSLCPASITLHFQRRDDALASIHAHLSADQRDLITFTDDTGNDVRVRPFTVRTSNSTAFLVHGQVTIIFVVSVGLSVCLFVCLFVCADFFSAVFDPISIKLGHMLYVLV